MEEAHTSDQSARILTKFLELFTVPAQGYAREELSPEQKELLRKLARGELDEKIRATLIPLLAKNEAAMEFLAEAAA